MQATARIIKDLGKKVPKERTAEWPKLPRVAVTRGLQNLWGASSNSLNKLVLVAFSFNFVNFGANGNCGDSPGNVIVVETIDSVSRHSSVAQWQSIRLLTGGL